MTILPPQPSSSPLSKWGPSGNSPPMRHIAFMWCYAVPLPLYPDKAAELEQIPHSGKSFWYSSCFSSEGPTWIPSCASAIYVQGGLNPSRYVLWLLVQTLRTQKVQVSWLCSFMRILILHQLFISGCLYLSQSVAEWSHSEDYMLLSVNITVSLVGSRIGAYSWDVSQPGTLIEWPFPPYLFHSPIPVSLIDLKCLRLENLCVGWWLYCSLGVTVWLCLATDDGLFRFHIPNIVSAK